MFVFLVCGVNEFNVFCLLLKDVSTNSLSTEIYLFVSFDVFDSVALETFDSVFFAIVTMPCTDFIMSKTFERNGLQEFTTFKAP